MDTTKGETQKEYFMYILTQTEQEEIIKSEKQAYEKFLSEKVGIFDGFLFAETFHRDYDKNNAIFVTESNDCADAETPFGTFHAGADGVTCYFMTEKPSKIVRFNRSVYFL